MTEFRFNRLNKMPKPLEKGGLTPSADPLLNFDILWQTLKEHYAFFNQRNINWDALRNQYRPQVNNSNLEEVIKQMLTHLNEDYVTLTTTTDDFLNRFDAGINRTLKHFYIDLPTNTNQADLKMYAVSEYEKMIGNIFMTYLNGNAKTAVNQNLMWGMLDDDIGYLFVSQMAGYKLNDLKAGLDEALNDLKNAKGLVIDIRGNLGGSDRVVLELAGRFITKPQVGWQFKARNGSSFTPLQTVIIEPTGTVQFTKPIRILTSIATASAAEIFTVAMKQNPYVKTVGESTNGIYSTILNKELPNGWKYSLSNEVVNDINGKVYEAIGVKPDVQVPFPNKTQRNSGIDPALDLYKTWF